MSVSVSNSVKDGVVIEEQLEAGDVFAECENEEQKSGGEGESARGRTMLLWKRPVRAREPPVTRMKKTAMRQVRTARVSNHPAMSCTAGRVKK